MGTESTPPASSAAGFAPRFRQRKISLKQNLRILWEKNLPATAEDVRGDLLGIVETGVDKSEEDERHLQAVLHSATLAGKRADAYIPTPNATAKFADYAKFYTPGWVQTESFIRSSATVEDAQGVEYCMDSEDLEFLTDLNKKRADATCSELEFESVCTLIEQTVSEKQPFLATDVTQLMLYKEAEQHILAKLEEKRRQALNPLDPGRLLAEANPPDYAPPLEASPLRDLVTSVKLFGEPIYAHWRARKIARHGKSVKPCVAFESGLSSDDQNPYVTFRRREVRHTRKTRRTDQQNSGRLRKLHREMHDAQTLFELVLRREKTRLQQIQTEFEVFELRCHTKTLKRKLRLPDTKDEAELFVSESKRARKEEAAKRHREEADRRRRAQLAAEKLERERERRLERQSESKAAAAASGAQQAQQTPAQAALPGSRIPILDHYTVEQQALDRSIEIAERVAARMEKRKAQNVGWLDATESAFVPYFDFFASTELQSNANKKVLRLPDDIAVEHEDTEFESTAVDVIHIGGEGTSRNPFNANFFSEIDFRRQPDRFAVPADRPSALLRKRTFGGQTYVDRVIPSTWNPMAGFAAGLQQSGDAADERLADRFKFDEDFADFTTQPGLEDDPARLNGIPAETQKLRFSSILTSKAGDMIADAQLQRRKAFSTMFQRMQQQKQQQQKQQQQRQAAEAAAASRAATPQMANARMQQAQKAAQRQLQRRKFEEFEKRADNKLKRTDDKRPLSRKSSSSSNTSQQNGQTDGLKAPAPEVEASV